MNKGLVSGLVLLTLGLISGLLLAVVNSFTAPVISENEKLIKYAAIEEFYTLADYDLTEITLTSGPVDTIFVLKDKTTGNVEAAVYSVKEYGYQSYVKMLIAIDKSNTVAGYKVVEQGETAGLGTQSVTHDFQMNGVTVPSLDSFDSISGSTITSNAVKACFSDVFSLVTQYGVGGSAQ